MRLERKGGGRWGAERGACGHWSPAPEKRLGWEESSGSSLLTCPLPGSSPPPLPVPTQKSQLHPNYSPFHLETV